MINGQGNPRTTIASRVRNTRARVKQALRTEPTSAHARALAADHLDAPHADIAGMRIGELLGACRGVGEVRSNEILAAAASTVHPERSSVRISPNRRLRDLTDRERDALLLELRRTWPDDPAPAAIASAR